MFIPLISIIVPVYNTGHFLYQCIDSLINQTYKNIEIILVNDGSTDNSLDICELFEKLDSRIIVINQSNQGVSQARNQGIKKARGDYIGFVDSDDSIALNMYEKMLNKIQLEGTQCATLLNFTVRPRVNKDFDSYFPVESAKAIEELFLLRFPTSMWAYLYDAKIIKSIQLSKDIYFFEDFEFNYRFLKKCDFISILDEVLYYYRENPLSVNHQEINSKKISCLIIHHKIKNDNYIKDNKELYQRSLFFKYNFIISMIVSSASSSSDKQKNYNPIIKKQLKGFILDFIKSKYIPLTYKTLIISFNVSPNLTIQTMNISEKYNIRKFGLILSQ